MEIEYYDFANNSWELRDIFLTNTDFIVKKGILYDPDFITKYPNKISKLDSSIKTVTFIKGTRFNRQIFRQMYPGVKIKYKYDSDCVIYDESKCHTWNNDVYDFSINVIDGTFVSHRLACHIQREIWKLQSPWNYVNYTNRYAQTIFAKYTNSKIKIDEYDYKLMYNEYANEIRDLMERGVKLISTTELFANSESPVKDEEITVEDAISIYDQITNKSNEIHKIGVDLLAMIDMEKYLPIALFFNAMNVKFNTHRGAILEKFIKDKVLNDKIYLHSWKNVANIDEILRYIKEKKFSDQTDVALVKEFFKYVIIKEMPSLGKNIVIKNIELELN